MAGPIILGFLFGEVFALRCSCELARSKLLLAFSASLDHETHLLLWDRLARMELESIYLKGSSNVRVCTIPMMLKSQASGDEGVP